MSVLSSEEIEARQKNGIAYLKGQRKKTVSYIFSEKFFQKWK